MKRRISGDSPSTLPPNQPMTGSPIWTSTWRPSKPPTMLPRTSTPSPTSKTNSSLCTRRFLSTHQNTNSGDTPRALGRYPVHARGFSAKIPSPVPSSSSSITLTRFRTPTLLPNCATMFAFVNIWWMTIRTKCKDTAKSLTEGIPTTKHIDPISSHLISFSVGAAASKTSSLLFLFPFGNVCKFLNSWSNNLNEV